MVALDKPWKVIVDDNFQYPRSTLTPVASFDTLAEAIAVCKAGVDRCLFAEWKPGISAEDLYRRYTSFGNDPWILGPSGSDRVPFSAWDYARVRCQQMCEGGTQ
jgi:hypothetical protein